MPRTRKFGNRVFKYQGIWGSHRGALHEAAKLRSKGFRARTILRTKSKVWRTAPHYDVIGTEVWLGPKLLK